MSGVVRITDVSPRDGLQAEAVVVDAAKKAELVRRVQASGVDEVEVSSFVSPKWIPQLGDAAEVFGMLAGEKRDGVVYSALVPNMRGFEGAVAVNDDARQSHGVERLIDKVSVFAAASEGFSLKNTNATIEETMERFAPIIPAAHGRGMMVRGYVSCVVKCPFDGDVAASQVGDVVSRLLELGVDEIDLGDTIGAGTPDSIEQVLIEVMDRLDGRAVNDFGEPTLTLHLHDTFGNAAVCIERAVEIGVRSFDSSAGGLGGCPYASTETTRASGNVSTLVLMDAVEASGMGTNVDRGAMVEASRYASGLI
ncbi:MAG: hydroxymethylglutaryl-CoA lyase [Phycisphaerales bacterium]